MIISQDYDAYTAEDHLTWSKLNDRQMSLNYKKASIEYQKGFDILSLDSSKVIKIEELSDRLKKVSGWSLIPVSGLIPTRDFFFMLINKKYPITVPVRKLHELDFSEDPDIFHDIYGHIPLLTNERFYRFLTEFSIIALKYVENEKAVEFLGRLYWFTFEMGVIWESGEMKPYGGAIITSDSEITNVKNPDIPKHAFDISKILNTPYDNYKLQKEYFVIDSFDDLFDCLKDLEDYLIANLQQAAEDEVDLEPAKLSVNSTLTNGFNNVIGFLNDIQFRFPNSISFAAGQPDQRFFNIESHMDKFHTYIDYLEKKDSHKSRRELIDGLGQYNKTKGIINEVIAEYLKKDEGIKVKPEDILVTLGAQEAFAVIVSTLCNRGQDVVLLENPSYIGVSSFAKVFGYDTRAVSTDQNGIDLDELKDKVISVNHSGANVKLVYVIPDYQNPSGCCMPVENRLKLLQMANDHNFYIIEDGVYNSFTYEEKRNPTLKSLDRGKRVIYVGSFSKSLFPGIRAGIIAAGQEVEYTPGKVSALSDEMAKVKALFSNNTPSITQAILAGILIDQDYSLSKLNQEKYETYKIKRDKIISALDTYVGAFKDEWAADIIWNEPKGGFFLKMTVPFEVTEEEVALCADKYGVIYFPMTYFYLGEGGQHEIRLTFSNLSLEQIEIGIRSFAEYLKDKVSINDKKYANLKAEMV